MTNTWKIILVECDIYFGGSNLRFAVEEDADEEGEGDDAEVLIALSIPADCDCCSCCNGCTVAV